jgi:hypothetical protein
LRKTATVAFVSILVLALPVMAASKRRAVRHPAPASQPVAVSDAFESSAGSSLSVAAPGVLANDTLNQGAIDSYGATGTEQTVIGSSTLTFNAGTVSLRSDGSFLYVSSPGFSGTDSFRYVLRNAGGTASAAVTITVIPTPPTATNDAFTTAQGVTLTSNPAALFANDSLNGATLVSYGASTGGEQTTIGGNTPTFAGGTVRVDAAGGFVYIPPSGFSGSDSFKYVVQNGGGSSTATVTIAVQSSVITFTVTSPGFFYSFSGLSGQNPVLTLQRGRTYAFEIHTDPIHPFEILDAPPGSVTNNNIFEGTLTFAVPATAANYRYRCSLHAFGNSITTVP